MPEINGLLFFAGPAIAAPPLPVVYQKTPVQRDPR